MNAVTLINSIEKLIDFATSDLVSQSGSAQLFQLTEPFSKGLERIEAAHGFYITFAGMLAVFIGLVVLWMSVMLFRKLLSMPEQIKARSKTEIDASLSPIAMVQSNNDIKIAALVGALIAYSEEYETDPVRTLPLKNISQEMSPWVMVAREQMLRK